MINPTRFEKCIGARINLRIFRWYLGTGHLLMQSYDTDDELSSSDDE
jgi:hypothetical protein